MFAKHCTAAVADILPRYAQPQEDEGRSKRRTNRFDAGTYQATMTARPVLN
jgi:hypothetical protein